MNKIIQIVSDHGYVLGLDKLGVLYKYEQNEKVYNKKKTKCRYETKWVSLLDGINDVKKTKWDKDELPF